MPDEQLPGYTGWCILEIFGHQRYAGYLTAEPMGQAVMFRIDVPALEERERITDRDEWHQAYGTLKPGTKVKDSAVQGYTKIFGAGAIYCITPCTQEAALKAVESMQKRNVLLVELPERFQLQQGEPEFSPVSRIDNSDSLFGATCKDCGEDISQCAC